MIERAIRLGPLVFHIQSEFDIVTHVFSHFGASCPADVQMRFNFFDPADFTLPRLNPEEIHQLNTHFGEFRGLEGDLMRHPQIRARLHDYFSRPKGQTLFIGSQHKLWIFDYSRNQADFLFSDYIVPETGHKFHVNFSPGLIYFYLFCPHFHTLMIHSSGLVRKGKAILFMGPSGTGKSTIAQLADPATILSDEMNLIEQHGDQLVVHPTPWGNISNRQHQAPLGALVMLKHAPNFGLRRIDRNQFLGINWDGQRDFMRYLPHFLRKPSFNLFYNACHTVPVYQMCFPKNYIDWDAIDAVIE